MRPDCAIATVPSPGSFPAGALESHSDTVLLPSLLARLGDGPGESGWCRLCRVNRLSGLVDLAQLAQLAQFAHKTIAGP